MASSIIAWTRDFDSSFIGSLFKIEFYFGPILIVYFSLSRPLICILRPTRFMHNTSFPGNPNTSKRATAVQ
ncbi:hypothetical protein CW304_27880 [Bacillus sp. UFRGS-B20]|nr:hypothetical protein CW304_27880 [Bacillus sp. UFRGS-B20]